MLDSLSRRVRKRVAVVGSGIAGLAAAYRLAPHARITLFEAAAEFGGHAHVVDVTLDGHTHGVDIAFSSINARTYPELLALFAELDVEITPQQLSFSVQLTDKRLEWAGPGFNGVFAQRRNLASPSYWAMLFDVLRFNRLARQHVHGPGAADDESVGAYLARHGFRSDFGACYLLPMLSSLWGCKESQMLRFPIRSVMAFGRDNGLFDVRGREPWSAVLGSSRTYVRRIVSALRDQGHEALAKLAVHGVRRVADGVEVSSARGLERFDHVVLACHADQALRLLQDPSADERSVLGAVGYQHNVNVLHTDASLMPRSRRAWAAWNYEGVMNAATEDRAVSLHYWLNRLQATPFETPLFATLNPRRAPKRRLVIGQFEHHHLVIDAAMLKAQTRLPQLQGRRATWYCGAWTGYGFHEDGVRSANAVAQALAGTLAAPAPGIEAMA